MLTDTQQRLQATDPRQSFIVQAPAGSGKTELLSQRFLRLLANVEQPEHIVALTFTRKAASEMKERILAALRHAQNGTAGTSAHQQHTAKLAAAALNNDAIHHWNLLKHPSRLRIMTIDALCQRFSAAIPLFEKELPFAQITDTPHLSYQNAARACLRDAIAEPPLQPTIQTLLEHLDNQQDRLIDLFCELLACREQWLEIIFVAKSQNREDLEAALKQIEQHTLTRLLNAIPTFCREEICVLSQQVTILENNPNNPRYALSTWHTFDAFNRDYANGLAHLLLTQENKLRRSFDHHVGLKKATCPDYAAVKQRSQELCDLLRELPDFESILAQVKQLPQPVYTNQQWEVLQALLTLLPLLAAELHLIFKQSNTLDFTQVTQQALRALGDEEYPTDLTLYLDHTIHHLLIDEFQDTSIQQIQLIEKLVHNWHAEEGKTVFVVGDPMQSIYRFRQAEVGLFLKVREEGIGPIPLTSLELTSNFRSTDNIITWINQQFRHIFPQKEDIESGAISFHPSHAVLAPSESSWIEAHQYTNKAEEAKGLIELVKQQMTQFPEDNVAILVRSRNQLSEIIHHLRQEKIAFQGVEINPLYQLTSLRDLWILTKALLFPACRLSHLALLRSPYCGLSLADLEIIANFDRKQSIYSALTQPHVLDALSEEGKIRTQFVLSVLEHALSTRHHYPLVQWIRDTAARLHGQHLIKSHQHTELEQFWQLLDRHCKTIRFPNLEILTDEFEKLYSKQSSPSRLQIMTIHKSKGLEFDCVIIPGLSSKSNPPNNPLIRWLKIPTQHHKEYLLVSPIKASYENESPLYNYLQRIDAEKGAYELQRLLYVAATRAKKRLYLLDNQERENKGTFRQLLKNQAFTPSGEPVKASEEAIDETPSPIIMKHLPIDFYRTPAPLPETIANYVNPPAATGIDRQFGIITHELLQWICTHHPQTLDQIPWGLVEQRCKQHGFNPEQIISTQQLLQEQIQRMLADPIGQWICQNHAQEKNEYALLVNEHGLVKTRVIDRTFIDQGRRWIIDFKTGQDDEQKQAQHKKQVNHYAELLALNSPLPISGGLYYLASNRWVSWQYQAAQEKALVETPV